ncbi:uncharacterized protein LOC114364103 [Ostrinia furnacalis]|uniref:uncharacterized protein LOC114364103 n=1 Tax=Ostrinia furnacalis TaxID=93504 RepID=UPI0010401177|nr:uncharacterized protein LOC114364103 [Ostrinia furnacalis]
MAPLTPAEKQKRYKEKLKQNKEKYEEYKKKKREHYHAKKRLVNDLTPKEKYNARVIWKLRKRNLRQKKKNLQRVLEVTPPSSPILQEQEQNHTPHVSPVPQILMQNPDSTKKEKGRKKVKTNRSKLYKENLKLKEQIEKLTKKCEKYKKRSQRTEKNKKPKEEQKLQHEIKYKKLSNAIKERYQNVTKNRDKQLFKDIFDNMEGQAKREIIKESLGLQGQVRTTKEIREKQTKLRKLLHHFFLRDDISRATAGKKETLTKNKTKVQIRFLLDSMKNLYKIFKQEKPETRCSYYYFTRNKPFFVIKPSVDGREMCLCKLHVNPTLKAQILKRKRVIHTDDLSVLISSTVCDINKEDCMYGKCDKCGKNEVKHDVTRDTEPIKWQEWGRKQEIYEKEGNKMKTFKNIKEEKEGILKELMLSFNQEFKRLKKHVYNMKIQFQSFRLAISNLQEEEAVIVVDFSENYECKYHQEIQAHHFGGSRQQVSLHTVVVYVPGKNKRNIESYCTVSASTNHQPAAIWAHLHPVLTDIRNNFPLIKTVHFFSDGPFSQYRQKQNFYLSSTKTFDYGFSAMTWSFFEAGHGKGPADGIGGFLKRAADNIVATGRDIVCAEQFYEAVKDMSKIKLFLISSQEIESIKNQLPKNITPLMGTLHVHQVFTTVRGELQYRNLSCFCDRGFCFCLKPKTYRPVTIPVSVETENILIESLVSSDDDTPLSNYKKCSKTPLKEVKLKDLAMPRGKKIYDIVYNTPNISDDDQEPSTSGLNKENCQISCGDFLIVNVHATKGKIFKYACVVNNLDDDGDIFVTFLRNVKHAQLFRLDKTDVSFIDYRDIVQILEKPTTKVKRDQTYYEFSKAIDIFEM